MTGATRWNDLAPRLTSALVMLGVGGVALALGGLWLRGLLALVCGAMIWEVIGLFAPHEGRRALALAAATAVAFFCGNLVAHQRSRDCDAIGYCFDL